MRWRRAQVVRILPNPDSLEGAFIIFMLVMTALLSVLVGSAILLMQSMMP